MIEKRIKIENDAGLRARPAALFVQVASRYKSQIWLEKGSKKVNAKSIMGVMSLGIAKGSEAILIFSGKDEKEASAALENLVSSNFSQG